MKLDLGIKPDEKKDTCCPTPLTKPSYPEFTLRDKNVDQFKEAVGKVSMDAVITATVQLRVKGMSNNDWGRNIELCVLSMEDIESEGGEDEEGEYDGHKNPAVARMKKQRKLSSEDPEDEPSIKA